MTRTRIKWALAALPLVAFLAMWLASAARADMTSKFRYGGTGLAAAANTDILPADLGPSDPKRPSTAFRLTIALVTTSSVVNVQVTNASTGAQVFHLNAGTALTAGNLYSFEWGVENSAPSAVGLLFNVQAETATTAGYISLQEVQ